MGATRLKCNFFLQICNEIPDKGRARARGACPPVGPSGDWWAPSTGATGGLPLIGRQPPLPRATGPSPPI